MTRQKLLKAAAVGLILLAALASGFMVESATVTIKSKGVAHAEPDVTKMSVRYWCDNQTNSDCSLTIHPPIVH